MWNQGRSPVPRLGVGVLENPDSAAMMEPLKVEQLEVVLRAEMLREQR